MPDAPRQPGGSTPPAAAAVEDAPDDRRETRQRLGRVAQPNMTPMIDVVFNLLIFFLCTGSFNQPEGLLPSRLPKHHGVAAGDEMPSSPIRIMLKQYGTGQDDYTIRIDRRTRQPNSFSELADDLRELRESPAFDGDSQVIVVADGEVRWDHLVNAFNAAVVARFKNITFGTQ